MYQLCSALKQSRKISCIRGYKTNLWDEGKSNPFLPLSPLQANRSVSYNIVSLSPLAITTRSYLQQKGDMTPLSQTVYSLNRVRKRARAERVSSLKVGVIQSFKNSARDKAFLSQDQGVFEKRSHFSVPPISAGDKISVCKDFTNIFMRHGARLQYQNILRKALLAL